MARASIWTSLAGFDAAVVVTLAPAARRRLAVATAVTFLPCLQIGATSGYGAWRLEGSIALAIAFGFVIGGFVLNLMRLANAAGGLHLPDSYRGHRRRSFAPPSLLAMLAATTAVFALPVFDPIWIAGFVAFSLVPHLVATRTTDAYEAEQRRQGMEFIIGAELETRHAITALLQPYREAR
jgi:hypothetical protein